MSDTSFEELFDMPDDAQVFMGIMLLNGRLAEQIALVDLGIDISKAEKQFIVRLPNPKRMGDLAREVSALPSTVTAIADSLERKGLAERERDPADRRAWLLQLTDRGYALRERMLAEAGAAVRVVTGLSDDEIEQFAALLRKSSGRLLENGIPEGLRLCDN